MHISTRNMILKPPAPTGGQFRYNGILYCWVRRDSWPSFHFHVRNRRDAIFGFHAEDIKTLIVHLIAVQTLIPLNRQSHFPIIIGFSFVSVYPILPISQVNYFFFARKISIYVGIWITLNSLLKKSTVLFHSRLKADLHWRMIGKKHQLYLMHHHSPLQLLPNFAITR